MNADDQHDAFIDETLAVWQPLTREPLTHSDARQIARDMGDFLAVLADWHRMEREAVEARPTINDAGEGAVAAVAASSAKSMRRRHA